MTNAVCKLFLIGLTAVPAMAQSNGKIRACVVADDAIPTILLVRAEVISARMFATAGVALEWRSGRVAGCDDAPGSDTVRLKLLAKSPAGLQRGALAYAQLPQGSDIVVMFDRIASSGYGMDRATQVTNILAHVMTHEIAHLLQGIARHSETGVMKAYWAPKDFVEMGYRPLAFAPEDIELIRLGMARRSGDFNATAEPDHRDATALAAR